MRFFRKRDENYSDQILSLMMIRFVILAMMLVLLAPRQEKVEDESHDRGNIRIEISWPTGVDADVDLWIKAPGEPPVGWNNKNGKVFDLVRDDLGNINNPSGIHYEIAYARQAPAGEYIANVHLFANRDPNVKVIPIVASITISKEDGSKGPQTKVATANVQLSAVGQELTLFRFTLDGNKNVVSGSLNSIFYPIYTK